MRPIFSFYLFFAALALVLLTGLFGVPRVARDDTWEDGLAYGLNNARGLFRILCWLPVEAGPGRNAADVDGPAEEGVKVLVEIT